ncbi:hypothetical protein MYAM1_001718 [Malassezia yamatoensis]|uniref:N-glycosylation protein EOS1 n=1 Tax=Malassezia yamatoensis TaxID=253288 RepID=A0AAJ6CGN2_9BASI|nr:hypothetical protein MYAM1_001718 [Malassezia yamatoensis]
MFVEDRGSEGFSVPHLAKRSKRRSRQHHEQNVRHLSLAESGQVRSDGNLETGDIAPRTTPVGNSEEPVDMHRTSSEMPPPYTAVEDLSPLAEEECSLSNPLETAATGVSSARLSSSDTLPSQVIQEEHRDGHDTRISSSPNRRSVRMADLTTSKAVHSAPATPLGGRQAYSAPSTITSLFSRIGDASPKQTKDLGKRNANPVENLEPLPNAFLVLLHSLRLFATVPGIFGFGFLFHRGRKEAEMNYWVRAPDNLLRPGALEYFICCAWALCTAYHALSLMTLLLRRWLIYYAVLPSVIRLIAFQSICWSLVRFSLYLFGPHQPLGGWLLVSSFTASVDVVARWMTSNITDVDEAEHDAEPVSDYPETGASDGEGLYSAGEGTGTHGGHLFNAFHGERYSRYREQSARLFRVIVGGPSDDEDDMSASESSDEDTKLDRNGHRNVDQLRRRRGFGPSNSATDSDASSLAPYPLMDPAVWRLRMDLRHSRARRSRTERSRLRRRAKQGHISSFFQNYRAARIHSRRVFHWEVAMWRNVMPIAVLGYLALWVLVLGNSTQSPSVSPMSDTLS